MGIALRIAVIVAASLIATPFVAMLWEPFYSSLLAELGIDTSPFGRSVAMLISTHWFQLLAVGTIGVAIGVWGHWLAVKFDRRVKPLSDADALYAAAHALFHELNGRIAYADRVVTENKPTDLEKWLGKANFQRPNPKVLLDSEWRNLDIEQAKALQTCRFRFDDLSQSLDTIIAGKAARNNQHAVAMYRDRAKKCRDELVALMDLLQPHAAPHGDPPVPKEVSM